MLLRELRFAASSLIRNPGFAGAGVGTLALGLGAVAAIFTVVYGVVLRPLPYPEADRLVTVFHPLEGGEVAGEWPLTRHTYLLFREENRTFEAMGAYQPVGVTVVTSNGATEEAGALATPGLWGVLGTRPAAGRLLTEADSRPGAPAVAVLGHELWKRRFGGDPGVVGSAVKIGGRSREVVGVVEEGLRLPHQPIASDRQGDVSLWLPYEMDPSAPVTDMFRLRTIARLDSGVGLAAARSELDRLTRRLTEEYPQIFSAEMVDRFGFNTQLRPLRKSLLGGIEGPLWIIFAGVGLVLLIACGNVANLFLVRAEGRRGEVSVRAALGAGRRDLALHFLAESLLMALLAGVVGLILAQGGVGFLLRMGDAEIPRLGQVALGWETVAFTGGLVLVTTLFLGAYPVLRFGIRPSTSELGGRGTDHPGGRPGSRVRDALVVGQVATALVLLVASGVLVKSFRRLAAVDPGFDPAGVLALEVSLPGDRYPDAPEAVLIWRQLLERIEALPGVRETAIGPVPLEEGTGCSGVVLEDRSFDPENPREGLECARIPTLVSPDYMYVMGIELVEGRLLEAGDTDARTGAVLVTRNMADRIWPDESPLGKGLKPFRPGPPFYRVVGVVGPIRAEGLDQGPSEIVFTPLLALEGEPGWNPISSNVLVKTQEGRAATLAPAVRRTLAELEPEAAVGRVRTMDDVVARAMVHITFPMFLLGIAGATALLLGTVGLYAVVAHRVSTRRAEMGIRMALGASAGQVKGLVFRHALTLALVGLALGLGASFLLNRTLRSLVFGVTPTDPLAMAGAAGLLLVTVLAAAWVPARRATRVQPASSLRAE